MKKKLPDPRLSPAPGHRDHQWVLLDFWPPLHLGPAVCRGKWLKGWSRLPASGPKVPPNQQPALSLSAPCSCLGEAKGSTLSHTTIGANLAIEAGSPISWTWGSGVIYVVREAEPQAECSVSWTVSSLRAQDDSTSGLKGQAQTLPSLHQEFPFQSPWP